jgi:hypothetical protein
MRARDIDLENKTMRITPEKNSNPASSELATRYWQCCKNYRKTTKCSATTPALHTCAAVSSATVNEPPTSSATRVYDK